MQKQSSASWHWYLTNDMKNVHFLLFCCLISYCKIVEGQGQPKCTFNEFRCEDGSGCLLSEKLCNGKNDCPGGEDEAGNEQWNCGKLFLGTSTICGDQEHFFRCRFGGCVSRSEVCNGVMDCWGGTDEASDLCENGLKRINPHKKPPPQISHSRIKPTSQPMPKPTAKPRPRPMMTSRPRPPPEKQNRPPVPASPPNHQPIATHPQPRPPSPAPGIQHSMSGATCTEDIPSEEGVNIKCDYRGKVLPSCANTPNGTIATYTCKDHYHPQLTTMTRRMCRNGVWTKRRQRWHCFLQCGKGGNDISGFITGGLESKVGKWPWNVGLYQQNPPGSGKYEQYCGGTLVSSKAVLTAAHCVTQRGTTVKRPTDEIRLYFGKFFRNADNNDEFVQIRMAARIYVQEFYDSVRFGSDIAVIWLETKVEITDRVLPVCLPSRSSEIENGDQGTLVGWGRYAEIGYPEALQEARIPKVSVRDCTSSHPSLEALVTSDSFCAGYRNGTSACDGDSGGGLVFQDTSRKWELHGIVSAGVAKRVGGCDPRFYTVFTYVQRFRAWIDKVLDNIDAK